MSKSSEIYSKAWDIATVIDDLEEFVSPVLKKLCHDPASVSEAQIARASVTMDHTLDLLKTSVSGLEDFSYILEDMFEELNIQDPDEPEPSSKLS